jgi:BlaI family transcriptional regulator, penicillinase repressor
MVRQKTVKLSKFELEIMEILWRLGQSSVREVQEAIQERKRPAYTTVQTIFARLEEKEAIRRTRKIGNAFLFEPILTRKSVYRRIIDDFLDLFGGSAEPIVAHLIDTGKLTLEDLKAMERTDRHPGQKDGLGKQTRGRSR